MRRGSYTEPLETLEEAGLSSSLVKTPLKGKIKRYRLL